MKVYSKEEVDNLIKGTINATAEGILEWLENETDIVDKDTKEVINNAEIDTHSDKTYLLTEYVYKRLEKCGIKFK